MAVSQQCSIALVCVLVLPAHAMTAAKSIMSIKAIDAHQFGEASQPAGQLPGQPASGGLPKLHPYDKERVQHALDAANAAENSVDAIAQEYRTVIKEAREKVTSFLEMGMTTQSVHRANLVNKTFDSARVQRALDAAEVAEKSVESTAQEAKTAAQAAREKVSLLQKTQNATTHQHRAPPTSEEERAGRVKAALEHAEAAQQSVGNVAEEAHADAKEARARNAAELLALARAGQSTTTNMP